MTLTEEPDAIANVLSIRKERPASGPLAKSRVTSPTSPADVSNW